MHIETQTNKTTTNILQTTFIINRPLSFSQTNHAKRALTLRGLPTKLLVVSLFDTARQQCQCLQILSHCSSQPCRHLGILLLQSHRTIFRTVHFETYKHGKISKCLPELMALKLQISSINIKPNLHASKYILIIRNLNLLIKILYKIS